MSGAIVGRKPLGRNRKNYRYAWKSESRIGYDAMSEEDLAIIIKALQAKYPHMQIVKEPRKEGQKYSNIYLIIG